MAQQFVILLSCGSYNPPTNMHLRMFEIARDNLHRMGTHRVLGGVISPVNDAYFKKNLAPSLDRLSMLKLALETNDWIQLSTWEIRQKDWIRTLDSLTHHQNVLSSFIRSNRRNNNSQQDLQDFPFEKEDVNWIPEFVNELVDPNSVQIKLLCGADLLESFDIPNLWLEEDIEKIVSEFGLVVVTREGCDPYKFIYNSDILSKHRHNIFVVTEWIPNEISSTRIRRALKRGESVKYLLQDSVIKYIYDCRIYDAVPPSQIKSDISYNNANDYLSKDLDTVLTQSSSNLAITPISPMPPTPENLSRCILEMNIENSSRAGELTRGCSVDEEKSDSDKRLRSSETSNQVPTDFNQRNVEASSNDDTSTDVNTKNQLNDSSRDMGSDKDKAKPATESGSSKGDIEDGTNDFNSNDRHCPKAKPLNNEEEDSKRNEANPEIDGKYIKSLVNSKKSPKKVSRSEDDSKRSRRKGRESRKHSYHSSSFRQRRYRDENSDDEMNTVVRSSIAKKPLLRMPSMTRDSLTDNPSSGIFLQGSLDSINIGAPRTVTGVRSFEVNSKKSKSYESIKRSDAPRLSLVSKKTDQSNVVSQSDSTSKLITANDFDLPTEEFCSVCYLPNEPSSAEIFYTVPSNCSSPGDDDSTKCDICSWNLQGDSEIQDQSVPDSTYETCEICGEPAASFDDTLNPTEEKRSQSLSLSLNKLSLRLDEGSGALEEEKPDGENDGFESTNGKVERRYSRSLTEPNDLQSTILFVPKDEIAMGKSGKRFNRKGSIVKKAAKSHEKRRYASVDNLQYTKYSFKIPGDKLIESKETKYTASADNIRNFRSRSLRRSADNIGRYDSSGDNLDSLDEDLDKNDEEGGVEGSSTKLKSDTIKMILTQHGIKIISGKETVL